MPKTHSVSYAAATSRSAVLAACGVLLVAACATPPATPPGGTAAPAGATGTAVSPPGTASAPAAPEPVAAPTPPPVDPAVARPQAAKLALEAVDQLQNGDEAAARGTLERALALDPANDLARKLMEQIRADAQKELGGVFFRYTVQRDDTLSKLAQQYMGDRYRFYILAKYNDIANPSRLGAGQVIRIPGRQPPTTTATTPPTTPSAEPVAPPPSAPKVAEPEQKPAPVRDEFADALARGSELEKSNLEGAYAYYVDVTQRNPSSGELAKRRDAVKVRLVANFDREATQAFQRQNLDLAISKWDKILEIDPANRKARLERERAVDLQKRMKEKFGNK